MSSRKSRLAATGTGGSEDTVEVTQKEKLSSSSSSSSAAASSSFDGRTSLLPSHLSAPAAFVQKEDFHLGKGMLVRAAYKKGKKYFRGTVHRVNANGTYDIMYNGGELEFKVERRFIDAVESRAEWKHRLHLRAMEEKKAKAIVDAALGKKKKQRQKNSPHDARPSGGGAATGGYDAKKLRSQSDAPFHRDSPLRSNLPWNCSVCRKPNNSTSENCRVCGTSKYYELAISKEKIMFVPSGWCTPCFVLAFFACCFVLGCCCLPTSGLMRLRILRLQVQARRSGTSAKPEGRDWRYPQFQARDSDVI